MCGPKVRKGGTVLDRIAVLATEAGTEANKVSTYVAWALCIAALIGIVIAAWRWL